MLDFTLLFYERLYASGIGFIIAFLFNLIAIRHHYYRPLDNKQDFSPLSIYHVITGFAIFLSTALIIAPLSIYTWYFLMSGEFLSAVKIKTVPDIESISVITTVVLTALAFILYFGLIIKKEARDAVLGRCFFEKKHWIKDVRIGALSWFLCYPLVFAIVNLVIALASLFFEKLLIDQVAIKQLKLAMASPSLFLILVILIIFVVPTMEELLFRGLFQSWLRSKIGPAKAIALTSLVFSFFHFSQSQGSSNFELIVALFILSCYLGFLYERQKSMIAPIALHLTFNAVSLAMFLLNS